MKNKILICCFALILIVSIECIYKKPNTLIFFPRTFTPTPSWNLSAIHYDNMYKNLIFDYENSSFITYTEPVGKDPVIHLKKINLTDGSIYAKDSLKNIKRLMNFNKDTLHGITFNGDLFLLDLLTKKTIPLSIPCNHNIFTSLYLTNKKLLFLGEVLLDHEFITGFFRFDLLTQKLSILKVLETNMTSNAEENKLKYMGYFSPQNTQIGYTFNVYPSILIISNIETITTVNLVKKENAILPKIDSYENQYFYDRKLFYSQGFFCKDTLYCVISLLNVDLEGNIIVDNYSNSNYRGSVELNNSQKTNMLDLYIGSYNNQPFILTYRSIYRIGY